MTPVKYDQDELLRRASSHPVAGPILEIIARDLVIEGLQAQLAAQKTADPAK